MTESDISAIEDALGVKLPADYARFLKKPLERIDETTVLRDADLIIGATRDYRQGFEGLKPWPPEWVYVGDEADACPYVLDCASGRVRRTDKGNVKRQPLAEYATFKEFVDRLKDGPIPSSPEVKRNDFIMRALPIAAMLVIFVILPLLAYSVSLLWKWAFGN